MRLAIFASVAFAVLALVAGPAAAASSDLGTDEAQVQLVRYGGYRGYVRGPYYGRYGPHYGYDHGYGRFYRPYQSWYYHPHFRYRPDYYRGFYYRGPRVGVSIRW